MKRALILGLGALLVLSMAGVAQAQAPTTPPAAAGTGIGPNFVDANGDGICDNFQNGTRGQGQGQGQGQGKRYGQGKGNGTHVGPQDGTGFGRGAMGGGTGTGTCDGTGPKGKGFGRRR
jgi:hypothetical protein